MLAAWVEWKQQCALDRCGEHTRAALCKFAWQRFRLYATRYAGSTNAPAGEVPVPEGRDAWHLFESHMAVKSTREGRRYKDWLFARTRHSADSDLDVVQGGATLIMRDVVRNHLAAECTPRHTVSIDREYAGAGGCTLTLADLLRSGSDPAAEAAEGEYRRLAWNYARDTFNDTLPRERVALLARAIGLPLSHPAVTAAAGCGKSVLCAAYQALITRVAERLAATYHDEDRASVMHLALMTIGALKERVFRWGKSEMTLGALFNSVEEEMPAKGSAWLDEAAALEC